MARQDEVLVDGHVGQGGKGITEYILILWLCNWGRELIRPSLHTRGRLCRRQANIKYIDKRSFYCMKKCRVLRLHNWCSVFSGVDQVVQLRTLMFLLVLGKGLSSELALPLCIFGFSDLSCSVVHERVWRHLGANTSLDASGECKK